MSQIFSHSNCTPGSVIILSKGGFSSPTFCLFKLTSFIINFYININGYKGEFHILFILEDVKCLLKQWVCVIENNIPTTLVIYS